MNTNEEFRHGSARKVTDENLRKAGMFKETAGPYLTTSESGKDIHIPDDGSVALIAGPGAGKTAGYYVPAIIKSMRDLRMNGVINSPRGEFGAMLPLVAAIHGFSFYTVNFGKFPWSPHHRTNPWDYLTPDNTMLVADCMESMADAIPISSDSQGKSKWWEDDARAWGCAILLWLTLRDQKAPTPKKFFQFLDLMQGEPDAWTDQLDQMLDCTEPLVKQFAYSIMPLIVNGKDGYTAPMSCLTTTFAFCKEPHYADAVSGDDFSMGMIAHPEKQVIIELAPPFEHLQLLAAPLRMLIARALKEKLKNPGGRRVGFWLDESGQLGAFKRIVELFTFARGAGCFTAAAYQEISQLYRCFGSHDAGNEILGSAQYRQFRAVGAPSSAKMVSQMAGDQTLEYNRDVDQSRAQATGQKVATNLLNGSSLAEAAAELKHEALASSHREKMHRSLITESEVLMSDQTITFAARVLDGTLFGSWMPFFQNKKYAGLILNNPYHGEKARMPRRYWPFNFWKYRNVPIVETAVPTEWQHLPQYQQGFPLRYPKGFAPRIRHLAN